MDKLDHKMSKSDNQFMPKNADGKITSDVKPDFLSSSIEYERSFFRLPQPGTSGLRIICGGLEYVAEDYEIDRENFPHLGMEWVSNGIGNLILSGENHALRAGSFFIYGPGISHTIRTDTSAKLVKYFIDFEGPEAQRLLSEYGLNTSCFRQLPPACGITELFDRLLDAADSEIKRGEHLSQLLLESIVLLAAENYTTETVDHGGAEQTYLRCMRYLQQHFKQINRIDDIASACYIDPSYMSRLFKKFSGISPQKMLLQMKMKAAALQLLREGMLVKEVAMDFGYADPYHFSKSFKKVHGESPEHYAKSRRTNSH